MAEAMSETTGKQQAQWYILHTYSGYENKVANNIMTLVENGNLHHLIEEVMVPTETITEKVTKHDSEGQEKQVEKKTEVKLFPSYVYVKMVMTDESWYICRNTRGVTGFVGPGSKPIPLTDEEIANIGVHAAVDTVRFAPGDLITILSGTLEGFDGTVKSIDTTGGTAEIAVSMFGRETQVTLELSDIKKVDE
jgi:transcriptional antiterminator NusG